MAERRPQFHALVQFFFAHGRCGIDPVQQGGAALLPQILSIAGEIEVTGGQAVDVVPMFSEQIEYPGGVWPAERGEYRHLGRDAVGHEHRLFVDREWRARRSRPS
jgi:hypothetical protein